jgi:hypothetical protein
MRQDGQDPKAEDIRDFERRVESQRGVSQILRVPHLTDQDFWE